MTDLDKRARSSPVIRKALVTLVLGAITYAVTQLLIRDPGSQLLVTVFVGGVTLVVQLLVEVDQRLTSLDERLNDLNAATKLFTRLERSPIEAELVLDMVRNAAIVPASPQLLRDFAEAEIARSSDLLAGLREGQVSYEGEDSDRILTLTRIARVGIDAISTPQIDAGPDSAFDFWSGDLGQRYLEEQAEAAGRIPIRRVFVLPDGETSKSDAFLRVCHDQLTRRVDVRWVEVNKIRPGVRVELVGLVLFDQVLTYEMTPAQSTGFPDKPIIVRTDLSWRPRHVEGRRKLFQILWDISRPAPVALARRAGITDPGRDRQNGGVEGDAEGAESIGVLTGEMSARQASNPSD